jgi:uncharacterized protein|tara:strand:+ start:50 stop:883 length:834 start_codon:yes stop_codon:yes gene_type:complete
VFGLSLGFGAVVGFSLGLTGGGGSIFAVPLLVYGLGVEPREAVGISLAAVGTTALVGAIQRLRSHEVEIRAGLLFAGAGILGAPLGTWVGKFIPGTVLLVLFALLMLMVAVRMWLKASKKPEEAHIVRARSYQDLDDRGAPACRHNPGGRLEFTAKCTIVMSAVGLLTGVLSGLFGVGGGFIIVPALVFFSTMNIHRAVATSLLVISLISASGVASYLIAGESLALDITGFFVLGGVLGLGLGTILSHRLSGAKLQKIFALAMAGIALFIVIQNVFE